MRDSVQHVAVLEARFLPLFADAAKRIQQEYPRYKFSSGSSSVGGTTAYQGHKLWLECLFPDAKDHEADCVAVCIGVMHVTTEPMLSEAGVAWGSGAHPAVEVEFVEHAAPLSREALDEVAGRVPELVAVFKEALDAWAHRDASA